MIELNEAVFLIGTFLLVGMVVYRLYTLMDNETSTASQYITKKASLYILSILIFALSFIASLSDVTNMFMLTVHRLNSVILILLTTVFIFVDIALFFKIKKNETKLK